MIKCNKCNAELDDNAVFCSNCGEKLVKNKTCPECQAICDNSVKFCSQCGFNFTAASKTQPQPDKKSKSASEISDDELAALNQALKNTKIPDVDDDNDDDQEPNDCFDIFLDGCSENKKMAESITTEKDSEKIQAQKNIDALLRQIVETSAVSYPVRIKGGLDADKLKKAYSKIDYEFDKNSILLHIDTTVLSSDNDREWMIVTPYNIFSKLTETDDVELTPIHSANFEISLENELLVNGKELISIAMLGLPALKLIKTLLETLKEISTGVPVSETAATKIAKVFDINNETDKIDFMEIFNGINDDKVYKLPKNNPNHIARWSKKYDSFDPFAPFCISKDTLAYMEQPGIFGISNAMIVSTDEIVTKKKIKVKINNNSTVKFQKSGNEKNLFVDGIQIFSDFGMISDDAMEKWAQAIQTIVNAKNAKAEVLLNLAERYFTTYEHHSFAPAHYVAVLAANKGCKDAMALIRKIALKDNYFFSLESNTFTKFPDEVQLIYALERCNSYHVTDHTPDPDSKFHNERKKHTESVINAFYKAYKLGNAEAAYCIAKILERGWGSESDIFAVIRHENSPNQESFVYWYKKSAEGGFQTAIEQVKKFEEWEKEIAEKSREELSPEAALFADKKQGILFDDTGECLLKYPADLPATNYSVPKCVEHIAAKAFYKCENLTSVTLPDTVTFLGSYSFADMPSLTEIKLSENLDIIKDNAFGRCEKLAKINLPSNLRIIESCAFQWCESLTEATIPNRIEAIPSSMFSCCKKLEKIVIGEKVVDIESSAFSGCENLKVIVWGKSLKHIKHEAFAGCTALTHFALPPTAYRPEYHVFDNCKNLTSVLFPDGTGSEHEKLVPSGCATYVAPRNSEYEKTAKIYNEAHSGNVGSQYKFALMLITGAGIKQNTRAAVQFFTQAAEAKYADAQYELGICFKEGKGVSENPDEARKWLSLASEQGNEKAAELLKQMSNTANDNESKNTVSLILENCGSSPENVCKKMCELFQLDNAAAKQYIDASPVYIYQDIQLADAEYVKQQLESAGAVLRIDHKN